MSRSVDSVVTSSIAQGGLTTRSVNNSALTEQEIRQEIRQEIKQATKEEMFSNAITTALQTKCTI